MQLIIERMLRDFESGRLTRRQLAVSLAAMVTGAQAAPNPSGLRAVSLNHVTVRVPDIQRTSQFYQDFFGMPLKQHSAATHILGVGKSFFGIEQKGDTAALDHYDFGIAGFNADEVTAKLKARNLKPEPGGNKESFKFRDPDGFLVQVNAADYVGHVGN
jgi:catechol 2,3-dioxygenase-like lactoylglutathione lyase family enzyme